MKAPATYNKSRLYGGRVSQGTEACEGSCQELCGMGVGMDAHESGYKGIGRNVKRRGRDSTEE